MMATFSSGDTLIPLYVGYCHLPKRASPGSKAFPTPKN